MGGAVMRDRRSRRETDLRGGVVHLVATELCPDKQKHYDGAQQRETATGIATRDLKYALFGMRVWALVPNLFLPSPSPLFPFTFYPLSRQSFRFIPFIFNFLTMAG